ncbi:hypothetical protein O181_034573 [Austropuccinia psidii MF-1]|uniref:DUF4939 domain-containing protein n=1 Tax=Austropuccinia psidii MF-1 TaxID=1389203 RepID=A0A9Q3H7H0_9BASI|nr:hypothetical protein [Austropuccinia psidii MF-1]
MLIQHSPPARQTRSQARTQAVLTPTPRAPLDSTPPEGRGPRRSSSFSGVVGGFPGLSRASLKVPGEDDEEEEENSVEEEESDVTEAAPAPVGAPQGTASPTLALSDQTVSHQSEPSLLAIIQQMTQIMANLQAASSSDPSRPPPFKTSSMKAPEFFDGTQPCKVRSFIQSCQIIFHNNLANFSQVRKKVLYETSFFIGRAAKWIEPYLANLTNQGQRYLLNSWKLFESQHHPGRKEECQEDQGPGEDGEEEEENYVEEEESDGTEGVPDSVEAFQGAGGPTLAQSNQPVSHKSGPSLLAIMQQMTQIMANLQAASASEASRPPAFKTPSIKAPEFFDETQPAKSEALFSLVT